MLENTGILVAGLSGGADSVCLVAVLKEIIEKEQLDIRLLAVHVNHGIRGTEAERDEQFAKQLCRQLSVEYISRRVDVPSVAHRRSCRRKRREESCATAFLRKLPRSRKSIQAEK